jgi:hypothetical protein
MAENDLVVPEDALAVGAEIAHGSNGVVHDATLCGVRVCAKVRRCVHPACAARAIR